MAADDDLEYYSNAYLCKLRMIPLLGEAKKLTKEEAESSEAYFIIKRDEKNRVIFFIKSFNGMCRFHFEYTYKKDDSVESVTDVNSGKDEKCYDWPIAEYLKHIGE